MKNRVEHAYRLLQSHGGALRLSEARSVGVDRRTLLDMQAAGLVVRETRGVYRLADLPAWSQPDLVLVTQRVPAAVVCLISALAFYALTTHVPDRVYIALPRHLKKPRLDYPPIEVVWLSEAPYAYEIERHFSDQIPVPFYSREKTIADCFKFRSKIGLPIALEALKDYLRGPQPDIERLLRCARVDRVEALMRRYLEAAL